MTDLVCALCGVPLTGGADTFGDWDDPLCRTCYLGEFDPKERTVSVIIEVDKSWLLAQGQTLDTLRDVVQGKPWSEL